VAGLIHETRADAVLNSVDPVFNVPIGLGVGRRARTWSFV